MCKRSPAWRWFKIVLQTASQRNENIREPFLGWVQLASMYNFSTVQWLNPKISLFFLDFKVDFHGIYIYYFDTLQLGGLQQITILARKWNDKRCRPFPCLWIFLFTSWTQNPSHSSHKLPCCRYTRKHSWRLACTQVSASIHRNRPNRSAKLSSCSGSILAGAPHRSESSELVYVDMFKTNLFENEANWSPNWENNSNWAFQLRLSRQKLPFFALARTHQLQPYICGFKKVIGRNQSAHDFLFGSPNIPQRREMTWRWDFWWHWTWCWMELGFVLENSSNSTWGPLGFQFLRQVTPGFWTYFPGTSNGYCTLVVPQGNTDRYRTVNSPWKLHCSVPIEKSAFVRFSI